jgi:Ni/Co efflux regulator RcnB
MEIAMRRSIFAALIVTLLAAAAPPAFAHERDHERGRSWSDDHHRDDRARAYKKGYRDGYRHGDDRDGWRDDHYRGYGGYAPPRAYYPPPRAYYPPRYSEDRRVERIVYGSWFGDDYVSVLTTYYGRPCHPYARWRGDWRRPYEIGYALPHGVGFGPPPPGLYRQLRPAPYGYSYVSVDGDLLLMADATRLIVDAILLSGR